MELSKTYDPHQVEEKWYRHWEEQGYFKPADNKQPDKKFSIVMPPPNVTGQLHIGHALDMTWQDILTRYKRQQGYQTCWFPGTDHAGIATQRKVRDAVRKTGEDMHTLGREKFIEKVWEWKTQFGRTITDQIRSLGASCDWSQEHFTMDEQCSRAVKEAFVNLYERGLIYKGDYIVNWCPECGTTLSDIEVEHEDKAGKLYHVAYPLEDGSGEIIIATTRPETILGDVAIAVHPDDERYQELVGKRCLVPIVGRLIPIIADSYVDKEFGSGAVKVTPAHDPNDFQMGLRHNLENIVVMTEDAKINENGAPYTGMDRYECRKAILHDLEHKGFMRGIKEHNHAVGQCYRCATVVEPMLLSQWFVKMKPLAEKAMQAAESGEVKFVPDRFTKIYLHWLENIRDWCISRQIWWGHQIPAWYCSCGEMIVSKTTPTECPKCGSKVLKQDEDVLDTWFSSALWPFSVQGWPDVSCQDMEFYPTSTMITGYDIIFFWVVRMITMGLELTEQTPFKDVLLHGLVRDSEGRKMSKSLGNGVDPLKVIAQYGADVLRFTLVTGNTPGNDMRFHPERLEANRNFCNKIWNASRFVLMNLAGYTELDLSHQEDLALADRWILSRCAGINEAVTKALERYEFGEAARLIYDFLWSEYCDWYIEMSKPRLYAGSEREKLVAQNVLVAVLTDTLQLLHPFMPFITEELWQALPHKGESIMIAPWPELRTRDKAAEQIMQNIMEAVRAIRNIRQTSDVKPSRKIKAIFVAENAKFAQLYRENEIDLQVLAGLGEMSITTLEQQQTLPDQAMTAVVTGATIYLPLSGLVDINKEIERLEKEYAKLQSEVARAEGKLKNERFVQRAPAEIVAQEKEKLQNYRTKQLAVKDQLQQLREMQE